MVLVLGCSPFQPKIDSGRFGEHPSLYWFHACRVTSLFPSLETNISFLSFTKKAYSFFLIGQRIKIMNWETLPNKITPKIVKTFWIRLRWANSSLKQGSPDVPWLFGLPWSLAWTDHHFHSMLYGISLQRLESRWAELLASHCEIMDFENLKNKNISPKSFFLRLTISTLKLKHARNGIFADQVWRSSFLVS